MDLENAVEVVLRLSLSSGSHFMRDITSSIASLMGKSDHSVFIMSLGNDK
eukprot:CAMPEP_0170475948 /NCGR_PEP_ID=MMETSP0123-20130129/17511_1 /TAXON_ID=182087 /ORGANISM="Favella ehrenbergii, Strain Fehren 1" /LENGTH=49 /DNA_ID=CAMNT_0010746793 /DNA_START=2565 /DNA_END=2714 /DNA_ORIENTATION=-